MCKHIYFVYSVDYSLLVKPIVKCTTAKDWSMLATGLFPNLVAKTLIVKQLFYMFSLPIIAHNLKIPVDTVVHKYFKFGS